jgi:replication-associated recombination protein RarA
MSVVTLASLDLLKEGQVEDPYGRPTEKVLLLSGPPGLGKTTLAHILAKQAGYQVHEINASCGLGQGTRVDS